MTLSVSKLPPAPVLSLISLLATLTPISAPEFDSGYMAELNLCEMPHFYRNSLHSKLLNGGLLLVSMTVGTPNCLKWSFRKVSRFPKSIFVGI